MQVAGLALGAGTSTTSQLTEEEDERGNMSAHGICKASRSLKDP